MNTTVSLQDRLNKVQQYATDYFDVIYKTVFPFWLIPEIPTGGNILTGGFAVALILFARSNIAEASGDVEQTLVIMLFMIFLIAGILIAFDPALAPDPAVADSPRRITYLGKLVSVVCVGVTLGCAFIVLDQLFGWIPFVHAFAGERTWSNEAVSAAVATIAALLACLVLLANTIFRVGVAAYVTSVRALIWTLLCFGMIIVGINLVVAPAAS